MDTTGMQHDLPTSDEAESPDPQPLDVWGFILPYDLEMGRYRFRRIVTTGNKSFDFLLEELDGRIRLEVSETGLKSELRKGFTVSTRIDDLEPDELAGDNIKSAIQEAFVNIGHQGPLAKWAQAVIRANGYRIGRED